MKQKEPCGCTHNGDRWIALCPACEAEWKEKHERAQADRNGLKPVAPSTEPDPWS